MLATSGVVVLRLESERTKKLKACKESVLREYLRDISGDGRFATSSWHSRAHHAVEDPLILSYSFEVQLAKLFEPLRLLVDQGHFLHTRFPLLVLIDGLS